jgi:hypothetical protein
MAVAPGINMEWRPAILFLRKNLSDYKFDSRKMRYEKTPEKPGHVEKNIINLCIASIHREFCRIILLIRLVCNAEF